MLLGASSLAKHLRVGSLVKRERESLLVGTVVFHSSESSGACTGDPIGEWQQCTDSGVFQGACTLCSDAALE